MKHINHKIKEIIDECRVPGIAFAIIQNRKIKSCSTIGIKNSYTGEIITKNTIFEASSLSKTVFVYGCFKLIERKLLNLDISLSYYLGYDYIEDDIRIRNVTARMVLNHTTGFPNWRPKNQSLKILHQPGERFSYSGEGFLYLQKTVEKILSQPIEKYMLQSVFLPLGMTDSSYIWSKDYKYTKAFGHDIECKPVKVRNKFLCNVAYTLHTTIIDYTKFMQQILSENEVINNILSQKIVIYDKANPLHKISDSIFWGLGWGLQIINKDTLFWQWGDTKGFKSYVAASSGGNAIIVFTNGDNGLKAIPKMLEYLSNSNYPVFEVLNKI